LVDSMTTRRSFLRFAALVTTSCAGNKLAATPAPEADLKLDLAKTFEKSTVRAVSADGTKLCMERWAERGYPLDVLDVGDWNLIYKGRFQSRPFSASFFGDSKALFVRALASTPGAVCGSGKGHCADQNVVIDLGTGGRTERITPIPDPYSGTNAYALRERTILLSHYQGQPAYETVNLTLVEFPEYKELTRVPYATEKRQARRVVSGIMLSKEYGFMVSDDRRALVYAFDDLLLCRRTDDLRVLWTRRNEPPLQLRHLAVSATGNYVAASFTDNSSPHSPQATYVYDGRDGSEVARLPQSGTGEIALSPDGRLLAGINYVPAGGGDLISTVSVYHVPSGRSLASIAHDRTRKGRRQFLEAGCSVAFTPDGKYLVTSGVFTKIWRLHPE
jgi:hypothetical protein